MTWSTLPFMGILAGRYRYLNTLLRLGSMLPSSREYCSLQYASIDDAVKLIMQLGPGTQLAKLDIKDAYRIVPVHPDDHHLLAILWEDQVYVDRALLFGVRSALKLFTAVADALAWALYQRGIKYLLHYLDDFLFLGSPHTKEAATAVQLALHIFNHVGVPVVAEKTEGPSTSITFLGIVIDTVSYQLQLPEEKVGRLLSILQHWRSRKSCTRSELESLLGHLAHAAIVVRPGRTFLHQLFTLLSMVAKPHHYVHLNQSVRGDIAWWAALFQHWDGSSLFPLRLPSVHIFSDASGAVGCGAFNSHGSWFQILWPTDWEATEIAVKEMLPVVVAAAIWGDQWAGYHVCFHIDDTAAVAVVQSRSAREPRLAQLLRCLFFYAAVYEFEYSAVHVPGRENEAADVISRNNVSTFSSLYPQVHCSQVPLPVLNLLVHRQADWGSATWTALFQTSLSTALFFHQISKPIRSKMLPTILHTL